MKTTKKKRRNVEIRSEEAMKQLQEIFKKRGSKALEMARKEVLEEKIECKEAREALTYFITEYWHDLARPTLLSLTCEAVGGDPELTTPIAVPMILISGAIDIHDDIIDESKTKNGRPTVYGKFGKDIALLIGDALLFKGLTLLSENVQKRAFSEKASLIKGIIQRTFFELGDAEAFELSLRGRIDISPEEYLQIIWKKAADVEAHTRISAIVGGGSEREIEALAKYGRLLGMLILLRDDWIDMIDLEEIQQRLRKECPPLPILYALEHPLKHELIPFLKKRDITRKDAVTIREIVQKLEGMKHHREFMQTLVSRANVKLTEANIQKPELHMVLQAMLPYKVSVS